MSAAYELGKAGYDCTVLEARDRVGGRNWTIRRGATLDMTDGSRQVCEFDEGLYWNAGAARLPSHHQAMLGYCNELGVALEVEVNTNRGALLHNPSANDGRPIELRQAVNDTRGEISELLGKAINRGALDQELTTHDKERMLAFLRHYGDLSPDLVYEGSTRAGYKVLPGPAGEAGVRRDPVPLSVLLDADMWGEMLFEENFTQQATMFQPVGGMDRIATAFADKLGPVVRLGREVTAIRRTDTGASVVFVDKRTGKRDALDATYCIVTIPLQVLQKIDCDFASPHRAAMTDVTYGNAVKVAWQSRRFWETDAHIYGGISWTAGPSNLVWYPSDRLVLAQGHPARRLFGARRCRRVGGTAATRAVRADTRGDRGSASRLRPRTRKADGHRLEQGAAQPGHRRALAAGPGERLRAAQPAGWPVLFRRRTSEPARRMAGRRCSLGTAGDQHDRPAQTNEAGVRAVALRAVSGC